MIGLRCERVPDLPAPARALTPTPSVFPKVDGTFANSYNFAIANLAGDHLPGHQPVQLQGLRRWQHRHTLRTGRPWCRTATRPTSSSTTCRTPGRATSATHADLRPAAHFAAGSLRSQRTAGADHRKACTTGLPRGPRRPRWGWVDQPTLSFAPSGQARGLKPYWNMAKNNIAPRFAVAFAPDSSTSIRAGFGMYYSHFGEGIVNSFSQYGSLRAAGEKSKRPTMR